MTVEDDYLFETDISAEDRFDRYGIELLGSHMAYVDQGDGDPVVFLHGNPTSSYIWRNIIPHVEGTARCLAPDLIGMGKSGKAPGHVYDFGVFRRFLDGWFEALGLDSNVTLVCHGAGGILGFDWAFRHQRAVKALVYFETFPMAVDWEDWPDSGRTTLEAIRGPDGERLILDENQFLETIFPASILRDLTEPEWEAYRAPFKGDRELRRPILALARMLPIGGQPADVVAAVNAYSAWLKANTLPKLLIHGLPGIVMTGRTRDYCEGFENQQEMSVTGLQFLQEDAPNEVGSGIARFLRGL